MKKSITKIGIILLLSVAFATNSGCYKKNDCFTHRYLTAKESAEILGNLENYYDEMSQKYLDFACQKKYASVNEFREYSMNQTLDFTDKEKNMIDDSIARIMITIDSKDYILPWNINISFAKTTMKEAMGAAGYTHDCTIFLGEKYLNDIEVSINLN